MEDRFKVCYFLFYFLEGRFEIGLEDYQIQEELWGGILYSSTTVLTGHRSEPASQDLN
jgi:hypothetical protein